MLKYTTVARRNGRIIGISRTYAITPEAAVRGHLAQYGTDTSVSVRVNGQGRK